MCIWVVLIHSIRDDKDSWSDWDFIITTLLEADVWVTLDFDSKYANHKWIHDNGWTDYAKFVPDCS